MVPVLPEIEANKKKFYGVLLILFVNDEPLGKVSTTILNLINSLELGFHYLEYC